MLSKEGFVYHVSQIQHETEMYNIYKSPISVENVEKSKLALIQHFEEQEEEIEKLKLIMRKYDRYANWNYAKESGIEL